jgi:hypothetical protein
MEVRSSANSAPTPQPHAYDAESDDVSAPQDGVEPEPELGPGQQAAPKPQPGAPTPQVEAPPAGGDVAGATSPYLQMLAMQQESARVSKQDGLNSAEGLGEAMKQHRTQQKEAAEEAKKSQEEAGFWGDVADVAKVAGIAAAAAGAIVVSGGSATAIVAVGIGVALKSGSLLADKVGVSEDVAKYMDIGGDAAIAVGTGGLGAASLGQAAVTGGLAVRGGAAVAKDSGLVSEEVAGWADLGGSVLSSAGQFGRATPKDLTAEAKAFKTGAGVAEGGAQVAEGGAEFASRQELSNVENANADGERAKGNENDAQGRWDASADNVRKATEYSRRQVGAATKLVTKENEHKSELINNVRA